jgi:Hepatocellular carcinoma-associated antigen 59
MAYVDSEMAKRRLSQNLPTSKPNSNSVHTSESESDGYEESTDDKRVAQRHPASLGKIHEIDLGADASLRNAERTETAIRRAQNAESPLDQDEKPRKPRKPRMGRDGKPMKPRPRKRRNSEDIKRDQLVEQVLRESRLEIYDEPAETTLGDTNNGDLDTDERIAEQFRQDFMDAMESRQRNRTAGQPKMPLGKPGEVGPKGPKLGGSRSARAAMRERELAEQQKGKR